MLQQAILNMLERDERIESLRRDVEDIKRKESVNWKKDLKLANINN